MDTFRVFWVIVYAWPAARIEPAREKCPELKLTPQHLDILRRASHTGRPMGGRSIGVVVVEAEARDQGVKMVAPRGWNRDVKALSPARNHRPHYRPPARRTRDTQTVLPCLQTMGSAYSKAPVRLRPVPLRK